LNIHQAGQKRILRALSPSSDRSARHVDHVSFGGEHDCHRGIELASDRIELVVGAGRAVVEQHQLADLGLRREPDRLVDRRVPEEVSRRSLCLDELRVVQQDTSTPRIIARTSSLQPCTGPWSGR
jgi:hypothetical protein